MNAHDFSYVECDVPEGMTLAAWRRRERARVPTAADGGALAWVLRPGARVRRAWAGSRGDGARRPSATRG